MFNKLNIVNNNYYSLFTISIGKFLIGFYFSINSIALVFFGERFNIQLTSLSVIFILYAISNIISNFLTGYISHKSNKKILNLLILFLFFIFCILISYTNNYYLFLLLYFFMGLITGTINTTTDTVASEVINGQRAFSLNISYLYYSLGGIAGPILFNLVLNLTDDFRKVYLSLAFITILSMLLISIIKYPNINYNRINFNSLKEIFNKQTIALFLIFDLALGSQFALTMWLPMLFSKELNIKTNISNLLFTLFLISIGLGRIIWSLINRKFKTLPILRFQSVLSCILFLSIFFMNKNIFIIVILISIGLFIGGVNPSLASYITSKYKNYSGSLLGFLYASGFVGMMVIVLLVSSTGDIFSLIKVVPFLFIPYFLISIYLTYLIFKSRKSL